MTMDSRATLLKALQQETLKIKHLSCDIRQYTEQLKRKRWQLPNH